jgi:photosystem II stability/assembly factor-like uncharacterized protein
MKNLLALVFCITLYVVNAQNWKVITPFNSANVINDMEVTPNGTLYVIADAPNRMYKSADGGVTWSAIHAPAAGLNSPTELVMLDDLNGYMLTNSSSIYKTTDGWETSVTLTYPANPLPFKSIFFLSNEVGFVAGYRRSVYKTTNGGTTWTSLSVTAGLMQSGEDLNDIHFINENVGFGVSTRGNVVKTIDGGGTWTLTSLQQNHYALEEVFFTDENTGYAAGALGEIYRTTDQGVTWTLNDTDMGIIYDMREHNGILYVTGSGKTFTTSADNGLTWAPSQSVENASYSTVSSRMYAVTFLNGKILVAGEGGTIFSKNSLAATTWDLFHTPIWGGITTTNLKFFNADKGLLIGSGGSQSAVYYTTNGGYSWTRKLLSAAGFYKTADVKENGKGLLVGNRGFYTTSNSGETWSNLTAIQPSSSYTSCWLKANNEFFVGTNPGSPTSDGMILYTPPSTWRRFTDMGQVGEIKFANEQTGYAGVGTANYTARLWKTTDGGTTWATVDSYAGQTIAEIQVITPNRIFVRDTRDASYLTEDGGVTWTNLTSITFPKRYHFFDEMNGYGLNDNQNVYKTEDGGTTWEVIIEGDNSLCGMDNLEWFPDRIVYAGGSFEVCILAVSDILQVKPVQVPDTKQLSVYPNPANSIIIISETVQSAIMFDISGKKLGTYNIVKSIDISGLEQGIYLMHLTTLNGTKVVKEVIKK